MNRDTQGPSDIENAEIEAWLDLFDAAPVSYAQENAMTSARIGHGACLAHATLPIPELNRAIGFLSPADILKAKDWQEANGYPGWVIQVPPDCVTADVVEIFGQQRLRLRGNGWAKFCRSSQAAIGPDETSPFDIRIATGEDAGDFGRVVQQGFGLPESAAEWFAAIVGRRNWTSYLAYEGAMPIASGAIHAADGWGWMGIDATLSGFRRRGAQSALIRARVQGGIASGLTGFTAETGQPDAGHEHEHASFSNYRRAGFDKAYTRLNWGLER